MTAALDSLAQKRLSPQLAEDVLRSVSIPTCPAILNELRGEIAQTDPDLRKIARMVAHDVALSASILRMVNSPYYGLTRRIEDIDQAVMMLGTRQIYALVSATLMRSAVDTGGLNLTRFWDVSAKRSYALLLLARTLKGVDSGMAQSFGLFCDIGIPLLMQRFPNYGTTLKLANDVRSMPFTDIERVKHGVDHAHMGAIMARTWGLSDDLCQAIRLHHDYSTFADTHIPTTISRLIALLLVADYCIQRFARLNAGVEWHKGGERAMSYLMLSDQDLDDWIETLTEGFAAGEEL